MKTRSLQGNWLLINNVGNLFVRNTPHSVFAMTENVIKLDDNVKVKFLLNAIGTVEEQNEEKK